MLLAFYCLPSLPIMFAKLRCRYNTQDGNIRVLQGYTIRVDRGDWVSENSIWTLYPIIRFRYEKNLELSDILLIALQNEDL